jgi:hypothetical protein
MNQVKHHMANRLKNWMACIRPEDLDLGDGWTVEYQNEQSLGAMLRLSNKSTGERHYFEIRLKELL